MRWWDATFCGIRSGSTHFAHACLYKYEFKDKIPYTHYYNQCFLSADDSQTMSSPSFFQNIMKTRAGVCKTLCPQLPDSNTVWLQHCLAMTVTTVQIYDFNVILSKGNNSKIGDEWDKKKIRITYFFMRNQNMKFQNISIHGSKLMLYTIKQRH